MTHFTQWPSASVTLKRGPITLWAGRDAKGRITVMKRWGGEENAISGEFFDDVADAQVWVVRKTRSSNLADWLGLVLEN